MDLGKKKISTKRIKKPFLYISFVIVQIKDQLKLITK